MDVGFWEIWTGLENWVGFEMFEVMGKRVIQIIWCVSVYRLDAVLMSVGLQKKWIGLKIE